MKLRHSISNFLSVSVTAAAAGVMLGLSTASADAAKIVVSFGYQGVSDDNNLSAQTGDGLTTISYNRIRGDVPAATIVDLRNTDGSLSGIGIARGAGQVAANSNANAPGFGPTTLTSPANSIFPATFGQSAAYAGAGATIGASFCEWTLSNLDSTGNTLYTFDFLSARNAGGPRVTGFTVTGSNAGAGSIESAFNTGALVHIADITPTDGGNIVLRYSNGTAGSFGYVNAFQMTATVVPEPAALGVLGLGSLMLLISRRRRTA